MKSEQEALEFFCKHFNLEVLDMHYVIEEGGYYCTLEGAEPPFENEYYYCYIGRCDNGTFWMMDANNDVPGERVEVNGFIEDIKEMLFRDRWQLTIKDDEYIWE